MQIPYHQNHSRSPTYDWVRLPKNRCTSERNNPSTGDQIAAYKASYEKWVADAHKIMLEAPSTWQDRFDVVLEKDLLNTGSEAAEDVRVSVGAL